MIVKVSKLASNLTFFIHLDRYRNEGTRTYSNHADYTEAQNKYRPNTINQNFDLIVFEVPYDQMIVYSANPPRQLADSYLKYPKVMFAIHPQVLKFCSDDPYVQRTLSLCTSQKHISVIPSSSTRTLYVEDQITPHAIKVHFPFKVSRYTRRMREEVLEQLRNGLDYNQIAEALFVSPFTIRKHIENIYKKLQVHNKMQAVQKAIKHNII